MEVREELIRRFGGLTAYVRAPVKGLWKEKPGKIVRDDLVIFEVLVTKLERKWWKNYERKLARAFRQEKVLIRVQRLEVI
jgi:hypothetical protein